MNDAGSCGDATHEESTIRADSATVSRSAIDRRLAPSRRSLLRAGGGVGLALSGLPLLVSGTRRSEQRSGADGNDGWRLSQSSKLVAHDGAPYDEFGNSVAVDGRTVVVGAPDATADGSASGATYVFRRDGRQWPLETTLRPGDSTQVEAFGDSVAVDCDTVVVGAVDVADDPDSGVAFVFRRRGGQWREETKLRVDEGERYDEYDYSVAVDGRTAVVGARSDDDDGPVSGSASVFRRQGDEWGRTAELRADDGETGDEFGYSVAMDRGTILVGAPDDADELTDVSGPGSAYVFGWQDGQWRQVTKLVAADGEENDQYGDAVAVDGVTAVVGAVRDTADGVESGSAYVYRRRRDQWEFRTELLPGDGEEFDFFGGSVDVDGKTVVVGASGDDDDGPRSGSAYAFRRRGRRWHQVEKIRADDGSADDRFGRSVAVDGKTVVVGASGDDENGTSSGSASVWRWVRATD